MVNLNNVTLFSESLKRKFRFRIASSTLRTIDKHGGYAVPYSQLELQTDITTTNDYAKAYGQQYAAQGYQGPMTVEGFSSAGYYGDCGSQNTTL